MACFLVPAAEAVIVTAAAKILEAKERRSRDGLPDAGGHVRFSRKLKWLSGLLWGGSALLAFEHLWHGEIVPWFPFLTAMNDPAETAAMLDEMASAGVGMALWVTAVWGAAALAAGRIVKRRHAAEG